MNTWSSGGVSYGNMASIPKQGSFLALRLPLTNAQEVLVQPGHLGVATSRQSDDQSKAILLLKKMANRN